jgi:hypothetical protein
VKYVMTFGTSRDARRPLDDGATRQSIADECREAALSFMAGVATGWDKLDLALWLTGPYARATRHGTRGERVAAMHGGAILHDETLELLVTRVRGQLLASLETSALELGSLEFAGEMVERRLVRRVVDAAGEDAWVPVDGMRARLRDRLQSLFVADYLCEPSSYGELFVCHLCEAVVFDAHAKQLGICGAHRRSGMVPRDVPGAEPIDPRRTSSRGD